MSIVNFTVEFDALASQSDSVDAGVDADIISLIGDVLFTPQFRDERFVMATGYSPRPAGFKARQFAGVIDADGRLKASPGGPIGVRLWANDPVLGLERVVYRVDFNLRTPLGDPVKVAGGYFEAPSADITINLTEVLESSGYSSIATPPTFYSLDNVASPFGVQLVRSPTAPAARAILGVTVSEPTGITATDTAAVVDALAAENVIRVEGGDYAVSLSSIAIPAGKGLLIGPGSSIKLAAGELDSVTSPGNSYIASLNSASMLTGTIDGNLTNQNKTAFNAAGGQSAGIYHNGIVAFGGPGAELTNLHVDCELVNVAGGYASNFSYVKDSYVRIKASNCAGAIVFSHCENLTVDIEADGTDNLDWKILQHAVDFNSCRSIRGRIVIRGQRSNSSATAGTGLSNWFSGLTMVDCSDIHFDEVDVEADDDNTLNAKGLGVSLLGVRNIHVSKTRIVGFSDVNFELGGVIDATFMALDVDGRYATGGYAALPYGANGGINMYNNAYRGDFKGRTLEYCRNIRFMGGRVRRHRDLGVKFETAYKTSWYGVTVEGNYRGLLAQFTNAAGTDAVAPSSGTLTDHRFYGCDFNYNEKSGVEIHDGETLQFHSCRAQNNHQSAAFGTSRDGFAPGTEEGGFVTKTRSNKTGLLFSGCEADDTQGFTVTVFPDKNDAYRVAVAQIERFGVGQTITLVGAGTAGADLKTRINDIESDELVIQHPVVTFPTDTLTGTIAVSGTAVTGSGTAFLTDLVGRAYIKVGSDYRRVVKVASNTAATIESAFPSSVTAGTALTIVATDLTTAHSQYFGYRFTTDTISPVLVASRIPTGNTGADISDVTATATRLVGPNLVQLNATATATSGDIRVAGPNTNHDINIWPQGDGSGVYLRDGDGNVAFGTNGVSDSENFLLAVNSKGAGSEPYLMASSPTNTDVGIKLAPQNAGKITIYNSAGSTPTIYATSGDSTTNLNLTTKNNGQVQVNGLNSQVLLSPVAGTFSSGHYYLCNSQFSTNNSSALGNTNVRVSPWLVTQQITISKLWAEVTSAGNAGAVFRIGIWNDNGGRPGTVFLDAGTIAADGATGNAEVTVSKVVPPGLYWIGGAVQSAATTQPGIRTVNFPTIPSVQSLGTALPAANVSCGCFLYGSAASGAFGDLTGSTPSNGNTAPRIGFKVA